MNSNLIKYSDKVDDAQNIVITGSSGWLSSNFLFHLKKFKSEKKIIIHKVSSENYKTKFAEITKEKLNDIIFIHNGFMRAEALKNQESSNIFKNQAKENLDIVVDFLNSNNIKSMFYPSSGSVYKSRNIDKMLYRDYSEQKLIEENIFIKIANTNKFDLLITRIFSSIGPFMTNKLNFALGSFIVQAMEDNKIIIESNTNDIYSFISLKNLSNLIIGFIFSKNKMKIHKFDAYDENLSLLDLANKVAITFDIKDLLHDFNNELTCQLYLGDNTDYLNLATKLNIQTESLNDAILKTIESYKKN
jgi:nucleoside-diphosphate-sugar epimerase